MLLSELRHIKERCSGDAIYLRISLCQGRQQQFIKKKKLRKHEIFTSRRCVHEINCDDNIFVMC